jgi:hypothetical protein
LIRPRLPPSSALWISEGGGSENPAMPDVQVA